MRNALLGLLILTKAAGGVWVLVPSQVVGWGDCIDCDGATIAGLSHGQHVRTVIYTTGPNPVFTTDTPEQVTAKYNAAQ